MRKQRMSKKEATEKKAPKFNRYEIKPRTKKRRTENECQTTDEISCLEEVHHCQVYDCQVYGIA